jgi:uncharacterized protein (DUF2249 family)
MGTEEIQDVKSAYADLIDISKVGPDGKFTTFVKDENSDFQFEHPWSMTTFTSSTFEKQTIAKEDRCDALFNLICRLKKLMRIEIQKELDKLENKLFKEYMEKFGIENLEKKRIALSNEIFAERMGSGTLGEWLGEEFKPKNEEPSSS